MRCRGTCHFIRIQDVCIWSHCCNRQVNPFSTEIVLLVGYWSPITYNMYTLLYTQIFRYKTPVYVPNLSVNWVYQLTGYKLSPMKWSNTANVQKIDVLMYLNARRLQVALGIQSMFLPMPIGGASIEWVKLLI